MNSGVERWQRRSGLVEAEVDGELIGLHIDNGVCYGFNATATRVWALLERPLSLAALCERLRSEFEVEPEECAETVLALLRELEAEGLVEPAPADGSNTPR